VRSTGTPWRAVAARRTKRPRWREFFARLDRSLETGVPFDRAPFAAAMCEWEQAWSRDDTPFATEPRGEALPTARRLIAEYRDLLP